MIAVVFPASKGIAAICLHTLSPFNCPNVEEDPRYFQPLDDPEGTIGDCERAKTLLAVPIVATADRDLRQERVARGVVVAINKEGNLSFTYEDIDNLMLYNNLASKLFDVITYVVE